MEGKRIQKPNMRPELGSAACQSKKDNLHQHQSQARRNALPYIQPTAVQRTAHIHRFLP